MPLFPIPFAFATFCRLSRADFAISEMLELVPVSISALVLLSEESFLTLRDTDLSRLVFEPLRILPFNAINPSYFNQI